MDTFEEEEGGDDVESSDSDNDDGDVGEFDPELKAKTKTLADLTWAESRVRAYIYCTGYMSRGRAGETAGWWWSRWTEEKCHTHAIIHTYTVSGPFGA